MGFLKGAIQKYTPKSVRKEVFDDIFGWETPMEALEGMGTGGLPLGLLGEKVEEKFGSLQSWDMPGTGTVAASESTISPVSEPEPANGDGLDSWAWTQNYLAGQRAVAEQRKGEKKELAEAREKQISPAVTRNGAILPGIVPAIILLYFVWTK